MDYNYSNSYMQTQTPTNPVTTIAIFVVALIFIIIVVTSYWKIFVKAKQPGWAAIIPIYNIFVLLKVVKRPGWWLLLYFIPFANIVVTILVAMDLAKMFGKSSTFGIFLNWLLNPIGILILGFGNAKYKK